jgi:signal transduction histidine kinase
MQKNLRSSQNLSPYRMLVTLLLLLSTFALINAIVTSVQGYSSTQFYDQTTEQFDIAIIGDVRTLAMVQREVLRLMNLMEADTQDIDRLDLQRSFVGQRIQQVSVLINKFGTGDPELIDTTLALIDYWNIELNPRVLAYIADGGSVGEDQRAALLESLSQFELDFSYVTVEFEISRHQEATALMNTAESLTHELQALLTTQIYTLIGFAVLLAMVPFVLLRYNRLRSESTARILELLKETKKLSQVASRISNQVAITDATGIIEWVNPAFVRRSGILETSLIGQQISSALMDQSISHRWDDCLRTHQGFTTETSYKKDTAENYAAIIEVQPSFDDEGALANYIYMETDVTELKRAETLLRASEQQLRSALEQERELSQIKSRLVSMTSHEFRTPLAVISTIYQSLRDFYDRMDAEQRQKRFDRMGEQIRHMTHMLDDILLINRIEEGKQNVKLEAFDLCDLLSQIIDEFRESASTHTLHFETDQESLPIEADPMLTRQIITNLLSNAIKYSPVGSTVTIQLATQADQAQLVVRDQGIGIPEADQPMVFDAFHRAENVGKIKGTGFGLSIVKHAVEMQNGHISFESKQGSGTTFTVKLPLPDPQRGAIPGTEILG